MNLDTQLATSSSFSTAPESAWANAAPSTSMTSTFRGRFCSFALMRVPILGIAKCDLIETNNVIPRLVVDAIRELMKPPSKSTRRIGFQSYD